MPNFSTSFPKRGSGLIVVPSQGCNVRYVHRNYPLVSQQTDFKAWRFLTEIPYHQFRNLGLSTEKSGSIAALLYLIRKTLYVSFRRINLGKQRRLWVNKLEIGHVKQRADEIEGDKVKEGFLHRV